MEIKDKKHRICIYDSKLYLIQHHIYRPKNTHRLKYNFHGVILLVYSEFFDKNQNYYSCVNSIDVNLIHSLDSDFNAS